MFEVQCDDSISPEVISPASPSPERCRTPISFSPTHSPEVPMKVRFLESPDRPNSSVTFQMTPMSRDPSPEKTFSGPETRSRTSSPEKKSPVGRPLSPVLKYTAPEKFSSSPELLPTAPISSMSFGHVRPDKLDTSVKESTAPEKETLKPIGIRTAPVAPEVDSEEITSSQATLDAMSISDSSEDASIAPAPPKGILKRGVNFGSSPGSSEDGSESLLESTITPAKNGGGKSKKGRTSDSESAGAKRVFGGAMRRDPPKKRTSTPYAVRPRPGPAERKRNSLLKAAESNSDEMKDPVVACRRRVSSSDSPPLNEEPSSSSSIVQIAKKSPMRKPPKSPSPVSVWNINKKRKGTSPRRSGPPSQFPRGRPPKRTASPVAVREKSPETLPPPGPVVSPKVLRTQGIVDKVKAFKAEESMASWSTGSVDVEMKEGLREQESPPSDPGSGQDSAGLAKPLVRGVGQEIVGPPRRASATKAAAMIQAVSLRQGDAETDRSERTLRTLCHALGATKLVTTEGTQQRPHSTRSISRTVELKPPVPPCLLGPPPSNPDIPSIRDYSCLASTWKQYEEVGYMHMETSSKEGWTKEKLIPLSGVKGRSLDISRLKWTSGLKSIPIWQLKDSDEFLTGVPFNERTAGEMRFAVQDCGAMRIDPPGVHDGSWFEQYVRPGMSDGQFLRTRPHMAGLNSYMYEPTLNGHYIRRAIEQDAKLKKNKTIQQIIETSYKKQLSIPLLLRKQIHDVNFWSTSGDVLFFSAHPNAYYEQIDDPFILSSLKDRGDVMRHNFPRCSKYGLLSSYPINIHTFGGRFEEIMLNWIAGPGLTVEWLYVNTGGTGTPFHHEPGGLASVNQNLGIIPPEGAVQTHPSSKIWTINYPAAYADFTHVMTSTGGEGDEYKLAYLNKEGGISRGLTNAVFPADNRPCTTTEQPVGSFMYVAPGVLHQVDNTGPTMSVARNIIDQLWIESGHIFIDQILGCDAKNPGGILGCCYEEAEEQAIRDNYKLRLDLQNRPEEFTTYMTVRTLMRCRTQDEKIAAKMDFELLKYMGGEWIEADKTILGLDSVVSQGEVCVLENGGGAFPVPPNHIIYNELTRKKYYPTDHRH